MAQEEVKKSLMELKVSELKNELEKRGLDKNGVKVTLVERLEKVCKVFKTRK